MKMRALAVLVTLVAAFAWGQDSKGTRPADPCAGKDDNTACTTPGGATGQCAWLTSRERDRLKIRTNTDCRAKGMHAGSCHTCVTEEQRKSIAQQAAVNDPGAAKKK